MIEERQITAELIRHLAEIERRRLHLEMGFGSMFDLLTKHFKFSEGAAARRLSAMRLAKEVPAVTEAIETGKLTLCAANQVQQFFRNELKQGKTYTPEQKSDLTKTMEGKSRRECEKELLKLSPESVIPKERERIITPTETEIRFVASEQLMAKLEKVRQLWGHHGELSYAELFERLVDQTLKKIDPEQQKPRKIAKDPETKAPEEANNAVIRPPFLLPTYCSAF